MRAVDIVQAQVDAYNRHDLEDFVANYSDDITVYRLPSVSPSLKGKAQFADFYATQRFNLPNLHAQIVDRIVLGNKVIDHERISGVRDAPFEVVVAYEVNGTAIDRVWMFAPE